MWEKIKDAFKYNLMDVLFMMAINCLFICIECAGLALSVYLIDTMGTIGFLMSVFGMMFFFFMQFFFNKMIYDNL